MKRVVLVAAAVVLVHTFTNGQYGFHRDELATIDDARHLAWGYVAYPPLTPFIARIGWALFGPSPVGIRFFAALAQAFAIVVTGLMTRELGGNRNAQLMAASAVAIAPVSIMAGHLFQYVTFDYLWWVLITYFLVRMLKSENSRWWLAIGTAAGLGALTKYTVGVLVVAIVCALLLTRWRALLASWWVLGGVGIASLIFLPNLLWQVQHHFVSVDLLKTIHARDVRIGRTDGFLLNQLFVPASLMSVPLWVAGLVYFWRRNRAVLLTFVFMLLFLLAAKGRDYYMAPVYPMLFAGGAMLLNTKRWMWMGIAAGGAMGILLLPIAPVNSALWNQVSSRIYDFREEIGWQDLVAEVAAVRDALPADERARAGVFANNYGEAGAVDLYGPALGLPAVMSGMNSYWYRRYAGAGPTTVIVLGSSMERTAPRFESCQVAGRVSNRLGVMNEEAGGEILVCRGIKGGWGAVWGELQRFG